MVEMEGTIERITYYNQENGFTVAKLAIEDEQDLVTAVGYFPSLEAGEVLKLKETGLCIKITDINLKLSFMRLLCQLPSGI